jgi:hypothetical protein
MDACSSNNGCLFQLTSCLVDLDTGRDANLDEGAIKQGRSLDSIVLDDSFVQLQSALGFHGVDQWKDCPVPSPVDRPRGSIHLFVLVRGKSTLLDIWVLKSSPAVSLITSGLWIESENCHRRQSRFELGKFVVSKSLVESDCYPSLTIKPSRSLRL